jgi:hypothetical protein
MKKRTKNREMLSAPSRAARHHHVPRGSVKPTAAQSSRPAGRARTVAARRGRSGGRNCVVTR